MSFVIGTLALSMVEPPEPGSQETGLIMCLIKADDKRMTTNVTFTDFKYP